MNDEILKAFLDKIPSSAWILADVENGLEICLIAEGPAGKAVVCFRMTGEDKATCFDADLVGQVMSAWYMQSLDEVEARVEAVEGQFTGVPKGAVVQ